MYFLKLHTGSEPTLGLKPNETITYGVFGFTGSGPAKIGYNPAAWVGGGDLDPAINDRRLTGITYALVLHPVSAVLAFLSLVFSICGLKRRAFAILATGTFVIGSLTTVVAFAVDMVLWSVVKRDVEVPAFGRYAEFGAANWLVVPAFIFFIGGSFSAGITSFSRNRYPRKWARNSQLPSTATHSRRPTDTTAVDSTRRPKQSPPGSAT